MSNNEKRKMISLILAAGIVCILLVVMTAYSAQLRCDNNALMDDNDSLQGQIDTLCVKIKTNNNVEYIEKVAINKLGMKYPEADEYVYVTEKDKPKSNFALAIKKEAYN